MVLQRWHGMSDREAVAAFEFDVRWKYACGGLEFDYGGFCHTVLVGMRARLAVSEQPRRIFDATLEAARAAGVVSERRVLDSTPIYDAVATQDTVTMVRGAIRGLLRSADAVLETELRAVLGRDDGYGAGGKPVCDWGDRTAREELVAALATDGFACLETVEGRVVNGAVSEAAELLAKVGFFLDDHTHLWGFDDSDLAPFRPRRPYPYKPYRLSPGTRRPRLTVAD